MTRKNKKEFCTTMVGFIYEYGSHYERKHNKLYISYSPRFWIVDFREREGWWSKGASEKWGIRRW